MQSNANNALGIEAIDHLEFCVAPGGEETSLARSVFSKLGMQRVEENPSSFRALYAQGQIRFVINQEKVGPSADYFKAHGEGVNKISFLVPDAAKSFKLALERGAQPVADVTVVQTPAGKVVSAAIKGFGDVVNEFVERPRQIFRPGFVPCQDKLHRPLSVRLARIDHLTNNVPKGEMEKWVEFYQRIYDFKVTRYFDIKGSKTGLLSKVVQSGNAQIIIPINEPEIVGGKSQIQEFLDLHRGAGVQHIALMTPAITDSVKDLRQNNMEFLSVPHTYYQDVPNRLKAVKEDLTMLEERQLLVDGDDEGYLLQNFSKTYIGPLFFEIIQRKNHWGFGEGNFQALFDAIEREQMERGYL